MVVFLRLRSLREEKILGGVRAFQAIEGEGYFKFISTLTTSQLMIQRRSLQFYKTFFTKQLVCVQAYRNPLLRLVG